MKDICCILFSGRSSDEFDAVLSQIFKNLLDNYIERVIVRFREQDVFVAVTCIAIIFEYEFLKESNSSKSIFRLAFEEIRANQIQKFKTFLKHLNDEAFDVNEIINRFFAVSALKTLTSFEIESSRILISQASRLVFTSLTIVLNRIENKNVISLVHVYLIFLWSLAADDKAMIYVEQDISWIEICSFLNALIKSDTLTFRVQTENFSKLENNVERSLSEDFIIREQIYSQWYFSDTWFKDAIIDDEERILKLSSMTASRVKRILWLRFRLTSVDMILSFTTITLIFKFNRWISFDMKSETFSVTRHAAELEVSERRSQSNLFNTEISMNEDINLFDIISTEDFSNRVSIDFSLAFEIQSDILASSLTKNKWIFETWELIAMQTKAYLEVHHWSLSTLISYISYKLLVILMHQRKAFNKLIVHRIFSKLLCFSCCIWSNRSLIICLQILIQNTRQTKIDDVNIANLIYCYLTWSVELIDLCCDSSFDVMNIFSMIRRQITFNI